MTKAKINTIKPALGLVRLSDANLLLKLNTVHDGMVNNPAYPTPPVEMSSFKVAIDAYTAAVTATMDGGKTATAARDKERSDVMLMLRLLGHYVEANCKNDMATFLSSGFSAAATTRTAVQHVAVPSIIAVDQGNTGQLKVTIQPVAKAKSYEVRYGVVPPWGGTVTWMSLQVSSTKPPVAISNLIRGTDYMFEVRAFGRLGFSDWSSSVDRMCI